MKTSSLQATIEQLTRPFRRRHALIFVLAALFVLIASVYTVNRALTQPVDPAYQREVEAKSVQTTFDQTTIDKINQLRDRQDASALTLPAGRINPFQE